MSNTLLPYKLLFVEDEPMLRKNYVLYLSTYFKKVYEAGDGKEAFEIYQQNRPDIMIVDINLPKINGLKLIKMIRENDQKIKIIILSAFFDKKYLLQATELKLTRYLVKPISRKELKEALDLAIEEISKYELVLKKTINLNNGYSWDCESKILTCNSIENISLTKKETLTFALLLSRFNHPFSYDDIIKQVWDETYYPKKDALKTLIKNLRKKLPENIIHNVHGIGYKVFY